MSIAGGSIALAGIVLFAAIASVALLEAGWPSENTGIFDAYMRRVLAFTLVQAVLSAAISVALAIPFARALARQPAFPGRIWLVRLLALPLGLPVITGALGILTVWGRNGWANEILRMLGLSEPISIYGLSGILLAHVFFNFPLAARLMLAGLERLPGEYWLLASNLGLGPISIFRHIEWPEIRRQIPGIAGLILMLAATSFTLVLLLGGGPAATTLEVAIYQALRFDFDPQRAVSLAIVQILLTALLLMLLSWTRGKDPEGFSLHTTSMRPDGKTTAKRCLDGALLLSGTVFILLPLSAIVVSGLEADYLKLLSDGLFWRAAATSLAIALPAGALAVLIAGMIISGRLAILADPKASAPLLAGARLAPATASLILLFPPTVLGTGWFLIAGPANVDSVAPVLIMLINGLMAFPFVLRILEPAMTTHRHRTGRLAASLGITGWDRWRLIDWPGLRKPFAMALSFATALSIGDLGVVALFGSDSLVTLPWLLYSRMGSYRTADAAGIALILAILCLLLTVAGAKGDTERHRHVG
nr:thiamine/thiamine pyrophosphate ABC transporter permease [Gellertiella hungarica]